MAQKKLRFNRKYHSKKAVIPHIKNQLIYFRHERVSFILVKENQQIILNFNEKKNQRKIIQMR